MNTGDLLRETRERHGLTIDELARRTKITVRILRALEQNAIEALPPRIFVRGFVRAYADEVGLDGDETAKAYMAQFASEPRAAIAPRAADDEIAEEGLVVRSLAPGDTAVSAGDSSAGAALALAAVALAVVGYFSVGARETAPAVPAVPDVSTAVGEPVSMGSAVATIADLSDPIGTGGATVTLDLHPTGPCWVEVQVNGETRIYRLMQPGERATVVIDDVATLRVGDPTAFAYSLDGQPGRPLGTTSTPVTVRLDANTFTGLVASPY